MDRSRHSTSFPGVQIDFELKMKKLWGLGGPEGQNVNYEKSAPDWKIVNFEPQQLVPHRKLHNETYLEVE